LKNTLKFLKTKADYPLRFHFPGELSRAKAGRWEKDGNYPAAMAAI
jgi:hypothetical protein